MFYFISEIEHYFLFVFFADQRKRFIGFFEG